MLLQFFVVWGFLESAHISFFGADMVDAQALIGGSMGVGSGASTMDGLDADKRPCLFQGDDLPPPPEDPDSDEIDDCRLWIGNLDNRVTE